jgi:HK97 family phage prohead protease
MKQLERRMAGRNVEVRAVEGQPTKIVGYGAVFNTETVIRSAGVSFREVIAPGAFRSVLAGTADVFSLFNHSEDFVLGRTIAGTLKVFEDEIGLRYEADINQDDPQAVGVAAKVLRGDVTGSSFGFIPKSEADGGVVWTRAAKAGDLPLRTVRDVDYLRDVGPVTFPAFDDTTAEVRSQAAVAARTVDDDTPAETAEETAAMAACQACADACAAAVAACSPLLSDEDSGGCCREAVAAAASTMATMGRAIASLGGQDIYSYYSAPDVSTHRARLELEALETV